MYSDGDFGLIGYLSYLLVPFHPLFQERGAARIERDQEDWNVRAYQLLYLRVALLKIAQNTQATRVNEEIYKSLGQCLRTASGKDGAYRHLTSANILKLEFSPYINRIISPPLRPVSFEYFAMLWFRY